jgi:hypothetical protein
MWIFLNSSFLSIVSDKDNPGNLLVRARRNGDIQRVFPRARVWKTPTSDYRYRASVPRAFAAKVLALQIEGIDYPNFKDSVHDIDRHMVYRDVWQQMAHWQEVMAGKSRPQRATLRQPKGRWRVFGKRVS